MSKLNQSEIDRVRNFLIENPESSLRQLMSECDIRGHKLKKIFHILPVVCHEYRENRFKYSLKS